MSITAKALFGAHFASDSATAEYQAPSNANTIIDKFTATNIDSGALTLSIYIVPNGGVPDTSNLIVKEESIGAGVTWDSTELQNQILNANDQLVVLAEDPDMIIIRASGRECT